MRRNLRFRYLSAPRYNRFLSATGNDLLRARKLYLKNIKLAQAFHPLLAQFEVVLRNVLNETLSNHFNDPNWIINQKMGFMNDASLANHRYFLKNAVVKIERNLNRRGIAVTSGKIISELNFGFWSALFVAHHYSLILGQPIHIFPFKPTTQNRASIYAKLDRIREYRNRVSHCEPLCFNGLIIDCSDAQLIIQDIYDLVAWIDPKLIPFFHSIDTTQREINKIMAI